MSVLVVVAHSDDEVLGCGGTIAKLTNLGVEVSVVSFGEGIMARDSGKLEEVAALREAANDVARFLGVKKLKMFELPCNRLDTIPLLDIVKLVEGIVKRHQPQMILTHWKNDLNVDHRVVHDAVLTATRPMVGCSVKEIYAFEVPSSTEWRFGVSFNPDTYVDITDTLEKKIQALRLYRSEIRPFPHPRSLEALQALATWRGSTVGVGAAEAFQTIRRLI